VSGFTSYQLRTKDTTGALAFYRRVLEKPISVVELPERAVANGAPPHWLGTISVGDLDTVVAAWSEREGQVLSRTDGVCIVKDPQGAVVALSESPPITGNPGIVWHELHTTDRNHAWDTYSQLCEWHHTEALDLLPPVGQYQIFADDSGDIGAMANTALNAETHTHWLYYFAVPDLELSLRAVRSLGGTILNGPMQIPGRELVAQCEDAEGATFALLEKK